MNLSQKIEDHDEIQLIRSFISLVKTEVHILNEENASFKMVTSYR